MKMINLIAYIVESTLILWILYAFYYLFLRNEKAFLFNRCYLIAAQILAIILPLISITPNFIRGSYFAVSTIAAIQLNTLQIEEIAWDNSGVFPGVYLVLSGIYLAGVLLCAWRIGRQMKLLKKISSKANEEVWKGYPVFYTQGSYPTFSFFNRIYFDNTAPSSEKEKKYILNHEAIHLKEYHSLDILFTELLKMLFWFNPVYSLILKAIRLNHEYRTDASIVSSNPLQKAFYQKTLAKQQLIRSGFTLGVHFNRAEAIKRISMMNSPPRKLSVLKICALMSLLAVVGLTFSCELLFTPPDKAVLPKALDGEEGENIYTEVDEQPNFQGSAPAAFLRWIGEHINYPQEDQEKATEGKIYIQFVIDKDGSVSNVEVLKNSGSKAMELAVLKAINASPRWSPGKLNDKAVDVRMILPIEFRFDEKN